MDFSLKGFKLLKVKNVFSVWKLVTNNINVDYFILYFLIWEFTFFGKMTRAENFRMEYP